MEFEQVKNIKISPLGTSSIHKKFLASYEQRNFEVSESTAQFVNIIKCCNSEEMVAKELSILKNCIYSHEMVIGLYEKCVAPILEKQSKKRHTMFIWETSVIPASVVETVQKYFQFLFNPILMRVLVCIIIVAEVLFFMDNSDVFLGSIDIYIISGVLLLFLTSSLFHELGHATACGHYSAEQRGIGFGLYLHFPAFYTDVSDIWKLPRKQRIVVNFAGVYFQLLFLLPLIVIFLLTQNSLLKYLILTINFNFIFTLNPFFKFDGYWIMTDVLGIPNLRARSNQLFSYVYKRIRGKTIVHEPFFLSSSIKAKILFIIYSLVVNVFFIFYIIYFIPKLIQIFVFSLPKQAIELINDIAVGNRLEFHHVMSIIMQILGFIAFCYMLYKMLKPFIQKLYYSIKYKHV